MESFTFKPNNVCSREMTIFHEGGIIKQVQIIGGCNGNLQGIAALLIGLKLDDVVSKLSGIQCRGSRTGMTSCPNELAEGIKQYLNK